MQGESGECGASSQLARMSYFHIGFGAPVGEAFSFLFMWVCYDFMIFFFHVFRSFEMYHYHYHYIPRCFLTVENLYRTD
jgi:hypothetical protein